VSPLHYILSNKPGYFINDHSESLSNHFESEEKHVELKHSNIITRAKWDHWKTFNNDILDRSYFQQTWIVQEIVCSRRCFVLYGGEQYTIIDWEDMAQAAEISVWLGVEAEKILPKEDPNWTIGDLGIYGSPDVPRVHISTIQQLRNPNHEKKRLLDLMTCMRSLEATDPRDRIFGLQQLAVDVNVLPQPDYHKIVEQVYTDFARMAIPIRFNGGFGIGELLVEAGQHKQTSRFKLPSWVPDWTFPQLNSTLNFHLEHVIDNDTFSIVYYADDSEATYNVEFRTLTGHAALSIRGQVLDKIEALSPKPPPLTGWSLCPDFLKKWDQSCRDMILRHLSPDAGELHCDNTVPTSTMLRYARLLSSTMLTRIRSKDPRFQSPWDDQTI
jgi:hypothetical protein